MKPGIAMALPLEVIFSALVVRFFRFARALLGESMISITILDADFLEVLVTCVGVRALVVFEMVCKGSCSSPVAGRGLWAGLDGLNLILTIS
jgi:hypothetical protein